MPEKKDKAEESDCPLSREGWVTFLSGKINALEMGFLTIWAVVIAVLFVFVTSVVTVISSNSSSFFKTAESLLFSFLFIGLAVYFIKGHQEAKRKVKPLEDLIDNVLTGKLKDSHEILERYLDAVKKRSDEEKALEKSNKEQKEALQAPQSDIGDLKRSLQEIKEIMEGTKLFNLFCVLGSLFVAIGLAIIFATISYVSHVDILPLIGGLFIFVIGILVIVVAMYKWIGVKHVGELWHTNKGLFCVFILVCAVLVALGLMVLTWFTRISF